MFKKFLLTALLGTLSVFAAKVEVIDSEQTFEQKVKAGKVLVDFYADWCGPCKRLGPVLEMVSDDMDGQVAIYKVNIDRFPELAKRYGVKGVPTLVLFERGKVQGELVGFRDKSAVIQFIQSDSRES